ncbi:Zn-dependent exopeptidase [Sporormia fimetaria CBS 119925]|uniref:Zn-dependent exopeptidase n=1 Tax=Sporormia fimetaria CBS 119925 TaxID=1340428 RepID=A0A6A6VCZ5_9PLEO|nr:Zn-dependent exopeptidase [Sporormia fimetaria CBS 119925]
MADHNERTPLLAVVETRPVVRDRYPHHTLRFVCTTVLSIVLFVGLVAVTVVLTLLPDSDNDTSWAHTLRIHPHSPSSPLRTKADGVDYAELQRILLTVPEPDSAREWSEYYTSGPHLGGKNLSQAIWTRDKWREFGVPNSNIVDYDIYVNYPQDHRLALLERNATSDNKEWIVRYEADLEEDVLEEDSTSSLSDRVPTFHGYSASGNVTASYVYVNYGTYEDFEELAARNVSLEGKIALIRYGGVFRGLKVKRAQEMGMIGAVIYSDPGDDGEVTEQNGYKPYPKGPARQPSSVQRGSVQYLSFAPGDPTTPGYPSKPGVPRQPVDHAIPSIPSIPISYRDALPLLKALNGHGPKASSFSEGWHTGGLGYQGVHYNVGPSPEGLALNLLNEQEYVTTPMWNVIGIINGSIPDEVVVLGNHRDAWIAGGSGDPNSGSAALNEVVKAFGTALAAGWKPLRTIVFASWDGEEYGLLGSTEWVEEYIPWLQATTIAYLNVDVATMGPEFKTRAAPLLHKILNETAVYLVQSPNQTIPGQTVGDLWDHHIATMGSGSDFTAFQDFAGITSLDVGFGVSAKSPIYHYHSNYDSIHWMKKFCDPSFEHHATVARIWALLAANLIETPVIQFSATDYAVALKSYLDAAKRKSDARKPDYIHLDGHWERLYRSLSRFDIAARAHDTVAAALLQHLYDDDIPWWKWWEKVKLYYDIRQVNTKYKFLERKFLFKRGLPDRPWFKHLVFAPGKWTGYSGETLPALVEAIDERNWYLFFGAAMDLVQRFESAAGWLE